MAETLGLVSQRSVAVYSTSLERVAAWLARHSSTFSKQEEW